MIKVHHVRLSRSVRVLWLLEELGQSYEVVEHQFTDGSLRASGYLHTHPLGQVPAIEDGATVMFESGAILEHLLEGAGNTALAPAQGDASRANYLQWFHFGEATLMHHVSDLVRARFPAAVSVASETTEDEAVARYARGQLGPILRMLDATLVGRAYVCGDSFTAADIMVGYGLTVARFIGELPREHAASAAYLKRLKSRPAYAKAWV